MTVQTTYHRGETNTLIVPLMNLKSVVLVLMKDTFFILDYIPIL